VPNHDPSSAVTAGALLSVVAEHPGQTNSWLAKHTGGDQTQLLALLKTAEQDGRVRREGERRGTRWWLTTTEDRSA
jgi:DNA-binding IclR family transcriptional regulator